MKQNGFEKRAIVYTLQKKENVSTEPIFIYSVEKEDHRRLWTLFTERVKLERAKYCLHVKIHRSRSKFCRSRSNFYRNRCIFIARVNGPLLTPFSWPI